MAPSGPGPYAPGEGVKLSTYGPAAPVLLALPALNLAEDESRCCDDGCLWEKCMFSSPKLMSSKEGITGITGGSRGEGALP